MKSKPEVKEKREKNWKPRVFIAEPHVQPTVTPVITLAGARGREGPAKWLMVSAQSL